jgi:pimeloyl-ACP methyl ester carboxylesterase
VSAPFLQTVEHGMFVRTMPGDPKLPSLVFVHGLGESGLCFEPVVRHPRLQPWRRYVVDLPGYGRSAWAAPISLEGLADHLAAWMRAAHPGEPFIPVGHSMGGVVALLLAERHPDLLDGVIDVDGNKSLGDCTFSSQAACQSLGPFENGGFDALRSKVYAAGGRDMAQRGYYASLRFCDPRAFHRHSVELVERSGREDLAMRLASLSLPKLYVAGQPGGACARSMELLREAEVPHIAIAPSGHWPFLDQPDAFVAALEAFLG